VATWLRNLTNKIGLTTSAISPPIPKTVDNQGVIAIIKIGALNRRTKYINIRYYQFREYSEQGIINLYYVLTSEMLANNFTKPLNRLKFITFAISIGMHD
jgi:hypothetical protein